jgi:uncharacterized protein (TIGR00255 family)
MTGFGEASVERDGDFVSVDVSSVNSQHSNIKVNLSSYPRLERRVEKTVRDRVERGKVTVKFESNLTGASEETVTVDREMVSFYARQADQLSSQFETIEQTIGAGDVLELPGVLHTSQEPDLDESSEALFIEVLEKALDNLVEMREQEGDSIGKDLSERVTSIRSIVSSIRDRVPEALDRHRENLMEKMEEVLDLPDDDLEERLENEMKKYADKCDISEEIVRIDSHLEQFEDYLGQDGAVGKSLEFLIQEIQREINTVGAKANDAEISQRAVDVKTELEKCREQVKNVE